MGRLAHKCEKGFSLAEAMMATVVLGFAAAGVLLPFTAGASVQVEGVNRTIAAGVADDMVEQIISLPFNQIISTYNGCTETSGHMKKFSGAEYTDSCYADFYRKVSCKSVYTAQQSIAVSPIFILVTVDVYYKGGKIMQLNRLVSK